MQFKTRPLEKTQSDYNFIRRYWIDSYSRSRIAAMVPYSVFFDHHPKLISKSMSLHDTMLLVDSADRDHAIGFISGWKALDKHYLNYVYIKQPFRGHNLAVVLATELFGKVALESPVLTITHQGNVGGIAKNYKSVTFDPYLFYKL